MFTRWAKVTGALILAGVVLAGCGDDDDGSTGSGTEATATTGGTEPTVVIDGDPYTCSELLQRECEARYVDAFERWGDGLDDYVNSGSLGEFNGDEYSYGEVADNGLTACLVKDVGGDEQDFIDILRDDYGADFPGTALLPLWFEAIENLCP